MWSTTWETCWSGYYENNFKMLSSKTANAKRYLTLLET